MTAGDGLCSSMLKAVSNLLTWCDGSTQKIGLYAGYGIQEHLIKLCTLSRTVMSSSSAREYVHLMS